MKKLIEALHVIKEECEQHVDGDFLKCDECPMGTLNDCMVTDLVPVNWKINDAPMKALL